MFRNTPKEDLIQLTNLNMEISPVIHGWQRIMKAPIYVNLNLIYMELSLRYSSKMSVRKPLSPINQRGFSEFGLSTFYDSRIT